MSAVYFVTPLVPACKFYCFCLSAAICVFKTVRSRSFLADEVVDPGAPFDEDKAQDTFEQVHRLNDRKDHPDGEMADRIKEKGDRDVDAEDKDAVK